MRPLTTVKNICRSMASSVNSNVQHICILHNLMLQKGTHLSKEMLFGMGDLREEAYLSKFWSYRKSEGHIKQRAIPLLILPLQQRTISFTQSV